MPKLEKTRLVLEDYTGNYWVLCHFAYAIDKFGEPYVKIMFPGFAKGDVSLTTEIGFREKDAELVVTDDSKKEKDNSSEITYHFISGILNLKGGKRYTTQYRWFPNLKRTKKPVLVCRCLLKDFQICKRIKSLDKEDLWLTKYNLPRVIGFYISYGENPATITRTDGRSHAFVYNEENLLITVTEYPVEKIEKNSLVTNEDPFSWLKKAWISDPRWFKFKMKLKKIISRFL